MVLRRQGGVKSRFARNFLIPPCCLLRRNGPVPGILAGIPAGNIAEKSERDHVSWRGMKERPEV